MSEVLCTFELSHKCCDNSSSAEKGCLFQKKQIFETPSLTAEMVTAAGEVEEQTVMVCQLKVIGRPLGSAN